MKVRPLKVMPFAKSYEERVRELEREGMTTSDAQSVASAQMEPMPGAYVQESKGYTRPGMSRLDARIQISSTGITEGEIAAGRVALWRLLECSQHICPSVELLGGFEIQAEFGAAYLRREFFCPVGSAETIKRQFRKAKRRASK